MRFRTILLGTAFWFGATIGASAQEVHTLKLSTHVPPSNAIYAEFERWGAELEQKSGGRLKLDIFASSQMGPPQQQFDIARTGVADIAYVLHGFTPGRFPLTEVAHLPGLFASGAEGSAVLSSLASQYLEQEHAGVRLLYVVVVPPFPILTRDKPIRALDDIRNMRVRHPGAVTGKTLSALGAVPVAVPPAEMGEALAKGVVDGIATTYEAAETFKFANSIRYATRIDFGTATFALVMNRASYDALPDDLRAIIDGTTGSDASIRIGKLYDETEAAAVQRLSKSIEAIEMSGEVAAQFDAAFTAHTRTVIDALEADGKPARAFYSALAKHR